MADYLEVDRNTVGNWINGKAWPRDRDLKQFALKTGFPVHWLLTGEFSHNGGGDDGGGITAPRGLISGTTPRKITLWSLASESNPATIDHERWIPTDPDRELELEAA